MSIQTEPQIVPFRRDTTLRWPCRAGDFLFWFRVSNLAAGPESFKILDFWEMRDGYHVTITNRAPELPAWFEIHPSEVCDSFVPYMMAKLEQGYRPSGLADGPNLWRLRAGDRVAWVGPDRPNQSSVNGILAILDCRKSALLVGEGDVGGIEQYIRFGQPTTEEMKPDDQVRAYAAVECVKKLGVPRECDFEWQLG